MMVFGIVLYVLVCLGKGDAETAAWKSGGKFQKFAFYILLDSYLTKGYDVFLSRSRAPQTDTL